MPSPVRIWLAFVVVVSVVACAQPRAFAPSDRTAIQGVLQAQQAAWNRGDLTAYMAGYLHGDALIFTSGGKIRHGWQDAYDHYKARYGSDRAAMGQLDFEIIEVDPVGADGCVVLGRWKLTGTEHAAGGVFTVVLERRPEGWRIVHDHTSIDAP